MIVLLVGQINMKNKEATVALLGGLIDKLSKRGPFKITSQPA